jgi:hypothetical protein
MTEQELKQLENFVSQLDFLFQEGVVFTQEQQIKIIKNAEAILDIASEINVLPNKYIK